MKEITELPQDIISLPQGFSYYISSFNVWAANYLKIRLRHKSFFQKSQNFSMLECLWSI